MPNFVCIFDFDHTLLDANSDDVFMKAICGPSFSFQEVINTVRSGQARWVDTISEHLKSATPDQIAAAVQSVAPKYIHKKTLELMTLLGEVQQRYLDYTSEGGGSFLQGSPANVEVYVVSDANTFFISETFRLFFPMVHINGIHSNLYTFDPVTRTSKIQYYTHSIGVRDHGCRICSASPNLCKSLAINRILDLQTQLVDPTIIYCGDGGNDFCPAVKALRIRDILFAKEACAIHDKLLQHLPVRMLALPKQTQSPVLKGSSNNSNNTNSPQESSTLGYETSERLNPSQLSQNGTHPGGLCHVWLWRTSTALFDLFKSILCPDAPPALAHTHAVQKSPSGRFVVNTAPRSQRENVQMLPAVYLFGDSPSTFRYHSLMKRIVQNFEKIASANEKFISSPEVLKRIDTLRKSLKSPFEPIPSSILPGGFMPRFLKVYASVRTSPAPTTTTTSTTRGASNNRNSPSRQSLEVAATGRETEENLNKNPSWMQLPWLHGEIYLQHVLLYCFGVFDLTKVSCVQTPFFFAEGCSQCVTELWNDEKFWTCRFIPENGLGPLLYSSIDVGGRQPEKKEWATVPYDQKIVPLNLPRKRAFLDIYEQDKTLSVRMFMQSHIFPMMHARVDTMDLRNALPIILRHCLWGNSFDLSMYSLEAVQRAQANNASVATGVLGVMGAAAATTEQQKKNAQDMHSQTPPNASPASSTSSLRGRDVHILTNELDFLEQYIWVLLHSDRASPKPGPASQVDTPPTAPTALSAFSSRSSNSEKINNEKSNKATENAASVPSAFSQNLPSPTKDAFDPTPGSPLHRPDSYDPCSPHVDIIMDNCGVECAADLLLALYLLYWDDIANAHPQGAYDSAGDRWPLTVNLHCKPLPFYVSDTMPKDIDFLVTEFQAGVEALNESLCSGSQHGQKSKEADRGDDSTRASSTSGCPYMPPIDTVPLVSEMHRRVRENRLRICADFCWVAPCEYRELHHCPAFEYLFSSTLVIVKGDLNFRRLVGDRHWPEGTSLRDAIADYWPLDEVPVAALRTMKSEVLCGVPMSKINEMNESEAKERLKQKQQQQRQQQPYESNSNSNVLNHPYQNQGNNARVGGGGREGQWEYTASLSGVPAAHEMEWRTSGKYALALFA